jgi:rhamnose utilization protein RhaD (predicted bifunctional aldolase and dehydrogenase)/NAD(P)-dependent dehydrogenase (short-subunit alcohol dehydrogenase family)
MTDIKTSPRHPTGWAAPSGDPLDQLVHLSHLMGQDSRLVQPGGGNTSTKLGDTLLVKGSGTDLRTITRQGFTQLSLSRLAALRDAESMSDAEMMRFMAGCMLAEGPAPSVETPLHSLLPHRVIAHTHDVATMSLTNVRDTVAERLVAELFQGRIVYLPYVRPGFPLAQAVGRLVGPAGGGIPAAAIGLALAHHGLVVWGETAEECYERLVQVTGRIDDYLTTKRPTRPSRAPGLSAGASDDQRRLAELVLPVVRGALGKPERVILHYDADDDLMATLGADGVSDLVGRGMATPEHLLRAGRLPVWLALDPNASGNEMAESVRNQIQAARTDYQEYHERHAGAGERPLDDWAKVVLAPTLGVITAFGDKRNAVTANLCYRAVLETIANAEAVDRFEFIPERDVFEFEHWPLERRKVEEQAARERSTKLLPRHIALIIGGGSGIGQAAAWRFAEEGAHVVVADLDGETSREVAQEIAVKLPGRAVGAATDVRDDASLDALFRQTVLEFGGLDCLFYTAGLPPRFAPITEIRREDLQRQLEVHYLGAVAAIGRAAAIMRRQGLGGSIVASVSKAALVPGRDAVAYGGSKAALLQALRVAAVELGGDGIRVNAINADQIETPLFLQFVRERAASRGVSVEEQLAVYRSRNLMGATLIPPEAVADIAVLLASDRFRFTTGDILTVDGGLPEAFPR